MTRLQEWPLSRLEREGLTLTALSRAVRTGNIFSRDVLRFHAPSLPQRNHSFEVGDEAILSRDGPLDGDGHLKSSAVQCEVVEIGGSSLSVALEPSASASLFEPDHQWRLDRIANAVAHQRTCSALAEWTSTQDFDMSPGLRKVIVEGSRAGGDSGSSAMHARSVELTAAMREAYTNAIGVKLNPPQLSAVFGALQSFAASSEGDEAACSVSLIQGPPGTGKSTAAVALLKLASMSASGPLLACADSNAAADNLLEGLVAHGVAVCRIGRPGRSAPQLLATTMEAKLAAHPDHAELEAEREQLRMLRVFASEQTGAARRETEQVLRDGWRRVRQAEQQLQLEVMRQSEVVVATLVGCGTPAVRAMQFPLVVVDECTQATEPRTFIAMACAWSSVVLGTMSLRALERVPPAPPLLPCQPPSPPLTLPSHHASQSRAPTRSWRPEAACSDVYQPRSGQIWVGALAL